MNKLKILIDKSEPLPEQKVKEAIESFDDKMEIAVRDFKRRQAEGEVASQNAYLTT